MRDPESPPAVGFHPSARRIVTFGSFRFDFADRTLWNEESEIRLPPRALGVLNYLLERPGRVVAKGSLIDAVWQDAHVSEASLTEAIGLLRQVLGDDPRQPRFIQTVHRRGYRFVAPLSVEASQHTQFAIVPSRTDPDDGPDVAPPHPVRRVRIAWRVPLALVLVGAGGLLAAWMAWRPSPAARVTRVVVALPPDQAPAPGLNAHTVLTLSPDGRTIVYVAGHTGSYRLFRRALDRFHAEPIPDTDGAHGPFFSPDGRSVAFFRGGRLMRIAADGGTATPLADAAGGYGGSWADDGTIVFAPKTQEGLWRVGSHGGDAVRITQPSEGESHRWPDALPDGTLLFTVWKLSQRDARIVGWHAGQGRQTTIVEGGAHARYLATGHLAYVREGALMVAPFHAASLSVTGPAIPVVTDLMTGLTGAGQFSIAGSGALLYLPDDPERRLRTMARFDGRSETLPLPLPPQPYQNLALAPDGRRIAATIPHAGGVDVWVGDLVRGSLTRLTFEGTNVEPVWSPDGRSVTYGSTRAGGMDIYRQPADGSEAAVRLWSHPLREAPGSWSPDGSTLAFLRVSPDTGADIFLTAGNAKARPIAASKATELGPRISPDGRWLAYQSNESGRMEVYVRALDAGGRVQVSTTGGTSPAWLPGTTDLAFASEGALLVARVSAETGGTPAAGPSRVLLADPDVVLAQPGPDGSFVLLRRTREHHPLTTMHLVLDWAAELPGRR